MHQQRRERVVRQVGRALEHQLPTVPRLHAQRRLAGALLRGESGALRGVGSVPQPPLPAEVQRYDGAGTRESLMDGTSGRA